MLVEGVCDSTGAVYGRLGQRGLVEKHVHEVAQKARGRAAIVVARVEVVRAYKHVVAGDQAHLLVATATARVIAAELK